MLGKFRDAWRGVRRWSRRVRGVGLPFGFGSISFGPDEIDRVLVAELKRTLDDSTIDGLVAKSLLAYYPRMSINRHSLECFAYRGTTFPILTKNEWLADPLLHPAGIHPKFTLSGRKKPLDPPPLAREYGEALRELDRQIDNNPIFAASAIGTVNDSAEIEVEVKLAKYLDYVFTAEILNAELRLELGRSGTGLDKNALRLRKKVEVLELDRYVAKIGLNVLTTTRVGSNDRFYVMDRSLMVMRRPLEYPNAVHVAPAGTVQPKGKEFRDMTELELETTLAHEFAEEFFASNFDMEVKLQQALKLGSANFFVTGVGIDALTHKLEICGLLVLESGSFLGDDPIESPEGRIRSVCRDELEEIANQSDTTLPAGALAIWQGLRYIDALRR